MFNVLISLLLISVNQNLWIDKTHQDFQAGKEYYYVQGDTVQNWNARNLRIWQLGAYFWSPSDGGLRILRRDLDIDDNGYKDVILTFSSYSGDTSNNILIYWNFGDSFSSVPTRLPNYRFGCSQGIHIADLNGDGYEDILIGEGCYSNTSYIFYGTQNPSVFTKDSVYTDYLVYGAQDLFPIDINGDGFLDLWIPGQDKVFILYGPNLSYRRPDVILNIPGNYLHHTVFADVNNDSYLDAIIGADGSNVFTIAYGPYFRRIQQLASAEPWEVSVADINQDGYLDLLSAACGENYIYWGSLQGYSINNRYSLYGPFEGACDIEDLNNDGILDLAIGEINVWTVGNSYVRYGPNYRSNYQILPGGSVVAADWNNDGYKDLLMYWFDPGAKLFWNRNGSFDSTDYTFFNSCPSDGIVEDFGNLWDRSNKERYLSRVLEIPQYRVSNTNFEKAESSFQIGVYGYLPDGITLSTMVRSSVDGIKWTAWSSPSGAVPQGAIAGGTVMTLGQYFQYRLIAQLDYHHTTMFVVDSVKGFSNSSIQFIAEKNGYTNQEIKNNEISIKGNSAFINLITNGKYVVYDVSGRQTKSLNLSPGRYEMPIANTQGVYFVNLIANSNIDKKKAIVTK